MFFLLFRSAVVSSFTPFLFTVLEQEKDRSTSSLRGVLICISVGSFFSSDVTVTTTANYKERGVH